MKKYLLAVVLLMLSHGYCATAYGGSFITESGLAACKAGQPYSVSLRGVGFKIPAGFRCEYFDVADVEEDDYSNPIGWTAPSREDPCEDEEACVALIEDPEFCTPPDAPYWGDRDGDEDLEAWCTSRVYAKKIVRMLVENSFDRSNYEAAQAAAAAAKQAVDEDISSRQAQVDAALAAFDAALADWDNADAAAVKAQVLRNAKAIRFLIKKELRK
jgi:hypothetical protein